MTLKAELGQLTQAGEQIARIRQSLLDEHAKVRGEVEDLLDARWTGQAAGQFGSAWAQWCEGMSEVLSGLGLESAAIGWTGAELGGTDADRRAAAARLHDRLGEVSR